VAARDEAAEQADDERVQRHRLVDGRLGRQRSVLQSDRGPEVVAVGPLRNLAAEDGPHPPPVRAALVCQFREGVGVLLVGVRLREEGRVRLVGYQPRDYLL
jgi:hypothetical protein